ncbi:hypothetical protein E1B28_005113 [Marasmius oreades]|uniref:Uncharacterized protein n=1 Tax=Marasmius oreades TaxID=181124 RepID=A0A9P7UZX5_9AGAR|nr:uncharacterized protein E1B28_005113 [Marasmius oreades]KAG7097794.1 hypothetical protein E1B28_005113 [Marasmius oreades]
MGWKVSASLADRVIAHNNSQPRETILLVDCRGRIFAVLGGIPPRAKDWEDVIARASRAFKTTYDASTYAPAHLFHRRGDYSFRNYGFSHGGGQVRPSNIAITGGKNKKAVEHLLNDGDMLRVAGHTGVLFRSFAYKMSAEYQALLKDLTQRDGDLKPPPHPNPGGGFWAAATTNTGPATCAKPHKDHQNYAPGWCAITPFGEFNPDQGGDLILYEIGLRIRFPPGATILIPSAIITHANLPIHPGETRYSLVQYTAGALFRYKHNGFKNDTEMEARGKDPQERKASIQKQEEDRKVRQKEGLDLYTHYDELARGDYKREVLGDLSDLSDPPSDDEKKTQ